MLPSKGGGQVSYGVERKIDPSDVLLPDGYEIEVITAGLTFPTGITFDEAGVPYVVESGYSYGEEFLTPQLLRLEADGKQTLIAAGGKNGPWNGVTYHDDYFYVSEGGQLEGGKILKISKAGEVQTLVEDLPSFGDHHTNGPAIKGGFVYFGQGTATNSGIVGEDNAQFGWLPRKQEFHDIPCESITVNAENFVTSNVLTQAEKDKAVTGPYSSFNATVEQGQVISGALPCSGAIMRVPVDGGDLELVAWGLRNPYGLAFSSAGALYVTENSYDVRGSRPIWGTGDVLWKIEQGKWYGWPDYNAGIPIANFKAPGEDQPKQLLAEHPGEPPNPVAVFGVHSSSNGIAFSNANFGHTGAVFVAQFGDMAPDVGKVISPVGYKVVKVSIANGVIEDFVVNKGKKGGPASWLESGGIERPVAVQFSPEGDLYIVDFGILTMSKNGADPHQKTGVIWKVTRK
ncbi:MAG: glucose dehydrogenase [Fulvivirga sp.]